MDSSTRKLVTGGVIVLAAVVLIAYDVFARVAFGDPATISQVLTQFGHQYTIIPFAFGVLMGHLFASEHPST